MSLRPLISELQRVQSYGLFLFCANFWQSFFAKICLHLLFTTFSDISVNREVQSALTVQR